MSTFESENHREQPTSVAGRPASLSKPESHRSSFDLTLRHGLHWRCHSSSLAHFKIQQRTIRRWNGLSLVEVMVGVTVGLILMTGVIQIFIGNKQTYRFHEALSRIQENGRFALEMLTNNIRMTDFSGCSSTNTVINVLNPNTAGAWAWNGADWWKNFGSTGAAVGDQFLSLVGYDGDQPFPVTGTNTTARFIASGGDRISGTDAIISLGGRGGYFITATAPAASPPSFTLTTRTRPIGTTLGVSDFVIVCDTTWTSIFQVSTVNTNQINYSADNSTNPGNAVTNLGTNYGINATMVDYVPTAFYVGTSVSGTTRSLYQIQIAGNSIIPMEIVEGVEDMQILYGIDTGTDNIIDQYVTATNVANWARVLSVRIHILLSSLNEDNLVKQSQTYIFPNDADGVTAGRINTPTDRRIYQVFSTTIGIRNRLP
ncbi:type IV pilus assembly protein PilW [Gammaproteobacteria bacterium]